MATHPHWGCDCGHVERPRANRESMLSPRREHTPDRKWINAEGMPSIRPSLSLANGRSLLSHRRSIAGRTAKATRQCARRAGVSIYNFARIG